MKKISLSILSSLLLTLASCSTGSHKSENPEVDNALVIKLDYSTRTASECEGVYLQSDSSKNIKELYDYSTKVKRNIYAHANSSKDKVVVFFTIENNKDLEEAVESCNKLYLAFIFSKK